MNFDMDLKDYFKPDKRKILILIMLLGASVLASLLPLLYLLLYSLLDLPAILFFSIPIIFTIITILVSYPFACYISNTKNWLKGTVIYLVVFIIMSFGIFSAITHYNDTVGRYCNVDSDCRFVCGQGAVNEKHIPLMSGGLFFGVFMDCSYGVSAICENNQCKTFDVMRVTSLEDCERVAQKEIKQSCYYHLAIKLNDKSICSKIEGGGHGYTKERCIKEFGE